MGERATLEIAALLKKKTPVSEIRDVRGTAILSGSINAYRMLNVLRMSRSGTAGTNTHWHAKYSMMNTSGLRQGVLQKHADRFLIVNPPQEPLSRAEPQAGRPSLCTGTPSRLCRPGRRRAIEGSPLFSYTQQGCFGAMHFLLSGFPSGTNSDLKRAMSLLSGKWKS